MQFAQDVVGDVPRRPRLAVQENGDLGVLEAYLLDEGAQFGNRFPLLHRQLFIIDRQNEGGGPALLLREGRQVAIAGHPQHVQAFLFDRLSQGADTEA